MTLAALLVALLAAGGAEAQQACTNTGGTCRPITQDGICDSGEKLEQASCGQVGMKCCAPEACAERAGFCHVGESACPGDTTRLGRPTDCGVNVGVCCTTSQLTCNQLLGHPGTCSQTEACPSGTNEGRTSDCVSCCNPPGSPPAPTPTPGPGGGTYKIEFIHTDALGSVRMVTDQSGAVVSRHDYYPFGGEIVATVNGRDALGYTPDPTMRQRFTGKERDDESGLDYFGARYYYGGMGRFVTPDSIVHPSQSALKQDDFLVEPERWNRYSYALNNPIRFADPDGREIPVKTSTGWVGGGLESAPKGPGGIGGSVALGAAGLGFAAALFAPEIVAAVTLQLYLNPHLLGQAVEALGPPGTPSLVQSLPTLAGKTGGEMYKDAVGYLKASGASGSAKASMMETFASQITTRDGAWEATRVNAVGGTSVFIGEKQMRIFVIDSAGKLYSGTVDALKQTKNGVQVLWDKVKPIV